ncbi:MAG: TetR/AcrR family transcriptional regulator [Collinsella sp.]|nr:TetR/AcrR family transcriptional regulator [Collinsella sp.]
MARNRYPEETIKRILDVAEALFREKGYEHTTMADIVDGLEGLTKGAVYHHFKSKEDIFEAVFERANRPIVSRAEEILSDRSLTGIEKIRAFEESSAAGPSAEMWHAMRPSSDPMQNSRLMAREYLDALDVAHRFIEPAIREGMSDGTVNAEFPRETAEVMLLLANLWMVPLYHPLADEGELDRRAAVLLKVMHALGIDLDALDAGGIWDSVHDGVPRPHREDDL